MKHRRQPALVLFSVALFCLAATGTAAETPGLVVEEVGQGSALEGAGIRPGDLLLSWEREASRGELRTVFDWLWVKAEQAPRGAVRLRGERNGEALSLEVPAGVWDAEIRPSMTPDLLQAYTEGRRRIEAGDLEGGVAQWDPLVQRGEPGLKSWILLQAGEARSREGQNEKARSAWQSALAEAVDPQTRVVLLEMLGESYQDTDDLAQSEASFRSALEAGEAAWGESLRVAATIARLGNVVGRTRLDDAMKLQARALEIRQRWTPGSMDVANSLNQLSVLAWHRGDLDAMTENARRALEIQERWSPGSLPVATSLGLISLAAMDRGAFAEAAEALQRALEIHEKKAPDSLYLVGSLVNLGSLAMEVGDLDFAEELQRRAMTLLEKLTPDGTTLAVTLSNLGAIAEKWGDLDEAERHYRRALAIWEKVVPDGRGVAGNVARLGNLARLRGDLDEASKLYRRGLELVERLAPGSVDNAIGLGHLGLIAGERGDLKTAVEYYQRSLAILGLVAPGSSNEAMALLRLGQLHRRMNQPAQAAQLLARAVDALEFQVGMLGVSQGLQAEFRASHEEIYHEAIEIEVEQGNASAAFHLVERSRARSFLNLLAERELAFSDLPRELERSRRDNAQSYDKALGRLAGWTPAAGESAREELLRELSRLRRERDTIAARIRKASPRVAELRQPQPLDLEAARKVLDPGTLALAYSVGKDRTTLFAVTREGGLQVKTLPVGAERLRQEVESFLEQVRMQQAPRDLARSLYGSLIGPVAGLVERSERVLILPDGPLHRLPFGALVRDTGPGQFLTEWKPLHTSVSLTVYGTLRSDPVQGAQGTGRLVAFGDPLYPKRLAAREEPRLRGLRSFDWAPLPHTRRELERIAEVYPGARLFLGEAATEEQAKSAARGARILHFATHGYTDDHTPLDSALVLTIPEDSAGRDNGLLQVWEIFESVRLDADLVVLSSCESALGRELSGEGLIGLTRAFQYAGAHSVVASLWSVADQVTAELMARFHRHLAAGLAKDEALRAAQLELIREPVRTSTASGQAIEMDASAPFFWAAFQLFGDWR